VLAGGAGDDLIKGGVDNDILRGDDGNDFLYGEAGDDTVEGGAGDDYIDGSLGDDLIYGGGGADFIKGGSGADIFAFRSIDDAGDTVYDMRLDDGDRIELSQLFAETGMDMATAISTSAVSLLADGRSSWLMVDTNGDAVQLAYLRYISADTVLDDTWLI
jgi:Ca2+-binding RTX toxin-like protein